MKNEYEEGRNELAEKKKLLIAEVNKGISSNIPLRKEQKKYLKNMLLFVILRTSKSKSANPLNLQKIVNKAFKKLFVRMIFSQSNEEELEEDEEFYEHNFILNLSYCVFLNSGYNLHFCGIIPSHMVRCFTRSQILAQIHSCEFGSRKVIF